MISLYNATAKPDRIVTKFLHHIAGLEAEFGELVNSYEFGWMAAEFGLPKSFCCSLSEQNGWLDYYKSVGL
jgi:hypothetical protein